MNPLERSLIEKAGYDNGWENVVGMEDDGVVLASSRHSGHVRISTLSENGLHLRLQPPVLAAELAHPSRISHPDVMPVQPHAWQINGRPALASFLRTAARIAQALPDQPARDYANELAQTLCQTLANGTEVERLVRQRVGQDIFRKAQLDYWGGRCAVTGLDLAEVLRASHAKPWADCQTDAERLDVFNGFLLAPDLDALFDRGFITFSGDGVLLVSPEVTAAQLASLRLSGLENLRLRWITSNHRTYLVWHREKVFRSDLKHG